MIRACPNREAEDSFIRIVLPPFWIGIAATNCWVNPIDISAACQAKQTAPHGHYEGIFRWIYGIYANHRTICAEMHTQYVAPGLTPKMPCNICDHIVGFAREYMANAGSHGRKGGGRRRILVPWLANSGSMGISPGHLGTHIRGGVYSHSRGVAASYPTNQWNF